MGSLHVQKLPGISCFAFSYGDSQPVFLFVFIREMNAGLYVNQDFLFSLLCYASGEVLLAVSQIILQSCSLKN